MHARLVVLLCGLACTEAASSSYWEPETIANGAAYPTGNGVAIWGNNPGFYGFTAYDG